MYAIKLENVTKSYQGIAKYNSVFEFVADDEIVGKLIEWTVIIVVDGNVVGENAD